MNIWKIKRAWCSTFHRKRVPHNGFGWIGTRCPKCGFMFFGEWEGWVHSNDDGTKTPLST